MAGHELMNYEEAAKFLGMRPSWLREAVRKGLVVCCKMGRSTRFLPEDLKAFARATRVVRAAPAGKDAEDGRQRPLYRAPDDEATLEERVKWEFGRRHFAGLVGGTKQQEV